MKMIMVILIIPDTCLIQHVFASACACMFTLSTASSDAPSSTSTRTVSACPRELAHINAVTPYFCEHEHVITVQRPIGLDEREHAHEYIYTCRCMHMYTRAQTSPMCVDTSQKKICKYVWTNMHVYMWSCMHLHLFVCVSVCVRARPNFHAQKSRKAPRVRACVAWGRVCVCVRI
jgi:hypothetical protein